MQIELNLTTAGISREYIDVTGYDSVSLQFEMLQGTSFGTGVVAIRKSNTRTASPAEFVPAKTVTSPGLTELVAKDWEKATYLVLEVPTAAASPTNVLVTVALKKNDGSIIDSPQEVVASIDNNYLDAFSRLRVSEPVTLFSSQCQYDAEPLLWESGATGTGVTPAHSANTRMVALSCTTGTGTSYIQSYEYIPYQAGKSQLIFATGLFGAAVADAVVEVGAFDTNNGIIYRQNGTSGLEICLRSSTSGSVVNTTVSQADWNRDPMDGTGASGLTIDPTKVFILVVDAQFLAMGRVRVGFDVNGQIYWAHEFLNANNLAVPYMQTLSLPIQMMVTATSIGSTKTSHFKCASVSSEGGLEDDLAYQFATPEQTVTAGNGSRTHILSLRPLTTFNGITNHAYVKAKTIEVLVTGNSPVQWELAVGSTFSAAPTYADVNTTYSATEYSSAVGTVSAVGLVVASGYVAASNQAKGSLETHTTQRYPITLDRAGAVRSLGTLSLFVTGIGGTSASRASITFSEIR